MIQSMTGFGERSFDSPTLRAKISIRSLNHRFLDWSYKGTPLGELENRLRLICQRKLHRGRIEVNLELSFEDPQSWELSINEGLLEKVLSSLERVSSRSGKEVNLSLDNIFRIPQMAEIKRKDLSSKEVLFLEKSFKKTLEAVLKERMREGREIAKKIRQHVQNIQRMVKGIERLGRKQPYLLREKLRQRLQELTSEASFSEEKMAEEAAYLAQRYDLSEEILRLGSHLGSLEKLLSPRNEEPAGKMLDFIAQELHREANTINSKSQDIEITKASLAIKGEVESIRQHIQNIE